MQMQKISVDKIEQNENSRVVYKEADLSELMHSLKKHGLLQPIGVKPTIVKGMYETVYGNRRLLAAKKLGWADIDCVIIGDAKEDTDRDILNLVENIKRQNTTLAEDGRMFVVLKDRGLSVNEIAERLDISAQRVQTAIDVFTDVPTEYRARIVNSVGPSGSSKKSGTISATAAHSILRIKKDYGLKKKQFKELLDFASKDESSVQHIGSIAPMLKEGIKLGDALQMIQNLERFTLHVFVPKKNVEKIERKYKMSVHDYMWNVLEALPELGAKRRLKPTYHTKSPQNTKRA